MIRALGVLRVRVLATAPGRWSWSSGANRNDPGLRGRRGSFTATAWSEPEKEANACRRGMLRPTSNGHAGAGARIPGMGLRRAHQREGFRAGLLRGRLPAGSGVLTADAVGRIPLPEFPAAGDWGLSLVLQQ
jgi:hypothetical protein